ncbi:hypothetical protein F4604DRAFT_1683526 [Suillus subluteus]|nr:hypothetical protein F4604DRAFT_1683526 [Suillus subluteus]
MMETIGIGAREVGHQKRTGKEHGVASSKWDERKRKVIARAFALGPSKGVDERLHSLAGWWWFERKREKLCKMQGSLFEGNNFGTSPGGVFSLPGEPVVYKVNEVHHRNEFRNDHTRSLQNSVRRVSLQNSVIRISLQNSVIRISLQNSVIRVSLQNSVIRKHQRIMNNQPHPPQNVGHQNGGHHHPGHANEVQANPDPAANQPQGQQDGERRIFAVPDFLEDIWTRAHLIAQDNLEGARRGLPGVRYPGIPRAHRAMLLLLAEERRHEIHRLLDELNEVECVLGIEGM